MYYMCVYKYVLLRWLFLPPKQMIIRQVQNYMVWDFENAHTDGLRFANIRVRRINQNNKILIIQYYNNLI